MQVNNRLFEIIYILLERKKVTAKELAEKFEVSTRTIYRDIDLLSASGIPIYAVKGKDGGISILDNYVLDKSLLSEEEQNQILFSIQAMKKINGQDEKDILNKMSRLFNKKVDDWIKVDFSNWGKEALQDKRFDMIKTAILDKKLIEFTYYNSNSEKSKRIVEPLQIWFKDKSWYLIAYCRVKNDYRIFKMARMKELKLCNEHFEREIPNEYEDKSIDFKTILLELEISNKLAYRVYDEFENEEITKNKDGNFIIKVQYPENEWIYGYILSFGEYIKVISPESIKDIIKKKAQKILNNYI